ncbi:MAG: hypothetical protein OEY22_01725 [Candidatus Bathyarchaeota archaeon]|nr:hypothetical protein [Candidatus Bathyarchaeota archaeon]
MKKILSLIAIMMILAGLSFLIFGYGKTIEGKNGMEETGDQEEYPPSWPEGDGEIPSNGDGEPPSNGDGNGWEIPPDYGGDWDFEPEVIYKLGINLEVFGLILMVAGIVLLVLGGKR